MSSVDDPIEAFLSQYPEQSHNVVGEVALDVAGVLHWPFKIINILRTHFFGSAGALEGLRNLAKAVQIQFEILNQELVDHKARIENIDAKLDSPEFKHATVLAATAAQTGTPQTKIDEMASVLVRSLVSTSNSDYNDDLSGFIRDVVNLTSKDIEVLRALGEVYSEVIPMTPNLNSPNSFTEKMDTFKATIDRHMHRDDFYAHCVRLSGFGLAIEVVRNVTRMAPEDYCFRPTRRGLRLLKLLGTNSSTDRVATTPRSGPMSQSGLRDSARIIVAPISRASSQAEYSLKAVDELGAVVQLGDGLPIRVPKADYIESRDEVTGKPKLLLTRKYFQGYFPGHEHAEEYFLPR